MSNEQMGQRSFTEIESMLRTWILEEGHPILPVTSDPAPTWAFAVAFNPNPDADVKLPIAVIGKEDKNRIELILRVELSANHKAAVNKKTFTTNGGLSQMRSTLLMSGVGFAMIHDQQGRITALNFDDILYPDGPLTHDSFMRALRRLYSTFVFCSDHLSRISTPQAELLE